NQRPYMYNILHHSRDIEEVEKKIIPLFKDIPARLLEFPLNKELLEEKEPNIIAYLNDEHLRDFLKQAADTSWKLGVLPHPDNTYTLKGLGISGNLEEVVKEILETTEFQKLDMLFCNEIPVFQAINIGDVFALTTETSKKNFTAEIYGFLKNISKISSLTHRSFMLSSAEEKIIHTSALGIIVVEHPLNSVIPKRLITKSASNDGMFYVLILSPLNIF